MIPIPQGADIYSLPGKRALGMDEASGQVQSVLLEMRGKEYDALPVGAILPPGYLRTLLPAYDIDYNGPRKTLPLFGYTALAGSQDGLYVAAVKIDDAEKWDPLKFNGPELEELISRKSQEFPDNRIVEQLAKCSIEYHCCTAQNIFYSRWEGGIPVSPACNARCVGCISLQPSECCPSPQGRIEEPPTVREVVELAVSHLDNAPEGIISFGQGCEGEPSLEVELLYESIREIRQSTDKGTININTNGGSTKNLERLCQAGLDSMRVSLISAREHVYESYYRPTNYTLEDVKQSLLMARDYGIYRSINLLVFPGFTDRSEEMDALFQLISHVELEMIQLRSLNIDPELFIELMGEPEGEICGIATFIEDLKNTFPHLRIGAYSQPAPKRA